VAFTDGGTPSPVRCGGAQCVEPGHLFDQLHRDGQPPITAQFSGDTHFTSSSASLAMYADTFQTAFASTGANQTFVVPGGTHR